MATSAVTSKCSQTALFAAAGLMIAIAHGIARATRGSLQCRRESREHTGQNGNQDRESEHPWIEAGIGQTRDSLDLHRLKPVQRAVSQGQAKQRPEDS